MAVVDAHVMIGLSSLSSVSRPVLEISWVVNPVIVESVTFTDAPVALNHPGNFSFAPFIRTSWLPAPDTVRASFRYGLMAVVCVVTMELSRISAPPAFTLSA